TVGRFRFRPDFERFANQAPPWQPLRSAVSAHHPAGAGVAHCSIRPVKVSPRPRVTRGGARGPPCYNGGQMSTGSEPPSSHRPFAAGGLARAAGVIAASTLASRGLGLIRDILIAALFGATSAKSAFVIAYYVPFFLQRLLVGGILSIVFIPVLSEVLLKGDPEETRQVVTSTLNLVLLVGLGQVLAGVLAAPILVPLAAPGYLQTNPTVLTLRHPGIREMGRLAIPAMLGLAIIEINSNVARFFASFLPPQPAVDYVAVLDYAFTINQAPVGIFALSLATALFPTMSRRAVEGPGLLRETTSLGLRGILFTMVPMMAVMLALSGPLVRVIFQRGAFAPAATHAVALGLAGFAVGSVPYAAYYVVTRTFYALHDTRTPVRVGVYM